MGEEKKVRIGFIGVGTMGQMAHLRNYAVLNNCEIGAVAEIRPELARQVSARWGIPNTYTDHRVMLASEQLDGIVATQPYNRHAVILPEVYPHVNYVFTEKPLALSVEAGERLAGCASAAGCVHMVGYHKRSDPATMYAHEVATQWKNSGEMGPLKYVRILMPAGDWIASGFNGLIRTAEKNPPLECEPAPRNLEPSIYKAYNSYVNYYIHQVNLMRLLLGEDYRVTFAEKSGVVMAVESVSGTPGIIEMTPYRTTTSWDESALIAFEKGYIKLNLPAPLTVNHAGSVEIFRDPGDGEPAQRLYPEMPWLDAMRNQASNFVKVCRGEMKPPCDAAEAVKDLKVALEYVMMMHNAG